MTDYQSNQRQWIFAAAAVGVWLAMGWPFFQELISGEVRGSFPVPPVWLIPYAIFGATVVGATILSLRTTLQRALLCTQCAAVVTMAFIHPKDLMSIFLVIVAWQVAMMTTPTKALGWIVFQSLATISAISYSPNTDLTYIMALSFVLQLCCVLTAQALKREAETAQALDLANLELRSAQAILANRVRDTERLRISQGLHDAWGHDLAALGLQLEIANNADEPQRVMQHVMQAKTMSRGLLKRVRDVVATLRDAEVGYESGALTKGTHVTVSGQTFGVAPLRDGNQPDLHRWIFSAAALAVALTLGWPILQMFLSGKVPTSAPWIISFIVFVTTVLGATVLKTRQSVLWVLLFVQVVAVAGMAFISSWAMMTAFLIITAWQVAATTDMGKALTWVTIQTLAVVGALALTPNPDLCWVIGKAFALQLLFVFAAQALCREEETARAFAQTNRELLSVQAIISNNVRNAERLRVSRELHDAWGHELTALGLQLEIASHVRHADRANHHITQAKNLAHALLSRVHDVVTTLHENEPFGLKDALEKLARSVPTPTVHVAIDPGVQVSPDQAHALIRCAQEAVTNAIRHSHGCNLWLQVTLDGEGVRLIARDDGGARPTSPSSGSGLLGMRERLENLGGQLAIRAGGDMGFTVVAWLPSVAPQRA